MDCKLVGCISLNSKKGLCDVKNILELVKIGDGKLVYTTRVGWLRLFYTNQEGENTEFI